MTERLREGPSSSTNCYHAVISRTTIDLLVNTPQLNWPAKPAALVLDLGNVVLDVDFKRAFCAWSASTGVAEERFFSRWSMDEPYQRHETGDLNFREYISHLSDLFEVRMSMQAWPRRHWR